MNLSEQGRMFSGTTVIEDAGDSSEPSLNDDDLEYLHGELSDPPLPLDVSCLRSDESYLGMAASEVSGADLLAALDSISFDEHCQQSNFVAKDMLGSESYGPELFGKRPDMGKGTSKLNSAVSISEPSGEQYGEAEISGGIDEAQKLDNPLIVYTSSQRRNLHSEKSNRINNPPKSSDICTKIASSDEAVDFDSLQISRRRSFLGNRPRSLAWGTTGDVLPDNSGSHPCSNKPKKPTKKKCVQKSKTSAREQDEKKSRPKTHASALPVIKIKLGNRSCTIGNVKDRKSTHGLFDCKETKVGDEPPGEDMVLSFEKNLEKAISADASVLSQHLDVTGVPKNPSFNVSSYQLQVSSQVVGDDSVASSEHRCSDVGTSPDSEVINSVPEAPFEKVSQHRQDTLTISNKACAPPIGGVSSFSLPKTKSKNGKKKDKQYQLDSPSLERGVTGAEATAGVEEPEGLELIPFPCRSSKEIPKCSLVMGGSKNMCGNLDSLGKKETASQNKGNKDDSGDDCPMNEVAGTGSVLSGSDNHLAAGRDTPSELGASGDFSKGSSGNSLEFISNGEMNQSDQPGKAWVLCDECQKWRRIPAALADQIETTNGGWTCKDNMDKDFAACSILQEKSNSEINLELGISDEDAGDTLLISDQNRLNGTKESTWSLIRSNLFLHRNRKKQTIDEVMVCHCKYPPDGRAGCGAKCLNRILNIECIKGTCPCGEFCSNQQFQKRKYAKLERFKCGKKGYGLQALEDISEGQFLIEYVGEVLDMHAYQARQKQYALNGHKHFYFMTLNGSEVIDACAKGNLGRFINHSCDPNCRTEKWMVNGEVCVGLFAVRNIKKGEEVTFDYNYVRVFGAAAKKCVCGSISCRGYIGGDPTNSEIIVQSDSEDEFPEPVMVCEDNEMKSDWSGMMLNSFDTREKGIVLENKDTMKKPVSNLESNAGAHTFGTSSQKINLDSAFTTAKASAAGEAVVNGFADMLDLDGNADKVDRESSNACIVASEDLHSQKHPSSKLADISLQSVGSLSKASSTDQHEISLAKKTPMDVLEVTTIVSPSKSLPDRVEGKTKLKSAGAGGRDELAKSNSQSKTHRSASVKKGKIKSNVLKDKGPSAACQLNAAPNKSKRPPQSLNSQFEAVEEKLNDLLEPQGGISKRKDASRGYLKLLFLTAASGNDAQGEAVQSNRDLSMILDALLKTKSRTVLVDIINKNGLQMLHNILKQNSKHYRNTPILRKLLRVLEHLATREILTLEHIAGGPPRPGVESFKDSILTLTEHADKQVHQTARNFRDRWIPRSLRKKSCNGRGDERIESHRLSVSQDRWSDRGGKPLETAVSSRIQTTASGPKQSSSLDQAASVNNNETAEGIPRKRKSRWDTPPEDSPNSKLKTNLELEMDDDKPPGFSSPCNKPPVLTNGSSTVNSPETNRSIKHPFDVVLGYLQPRFVSCMPLSYGVPASIVQQFGVANSTGWTVGPAMPFYPFPPLPPYKKLDRPVEPTEKVGSGGDIFVDNLSGKKHTRAWNIDPEEKTIHTANDRADVQRGASHCLDRKYFKQQKLNHSKLAPPWVRMRNGWGHNGNNIRNVQPGVGLGNGTNEFRNSYMEEGNWR